jgi:hypothetical protein
MSHTALAFADAKTPCSFGTAFLVCMVLCDSLVGSERKGGGLPSFATAFIRGHKLCSTRTATRKKDAELTEGSKNTTRDWAKELFPV